MTEERKQKILERATMTMKVIAQLPLMEDKEARKTANMVYFYCRKAACKNDEDEEVWESVFKHRMPLGEDDAKSFVALILDEPPQA